MADVSIRNLNDHVREKLRSRAAGNGRCMEAEMRAILEEAVADPQPSRNLLAWIGALSLCAVPAAIGGTLGGLYSTRTERIGWSRLRKHLNNDAEERLLRVVLGRTPAPRAWDDLFSDRPTTFIRVRTVDGFWLAGSFADNSYAGGFPNETDLFLEEAWEIDSEGVLRDHSLGYPVYIAAHQIAWLELVHPISEIEGGNDDGS